MALPDSDLFIEINLGDIDIHLIFELFNKSELFISPKQDTNELPFFFEINNIISQNKTTYKCSLWII